MSTTLKKLELVSGNNQAILKEFLGYLQSKDSRSDHHSNSLLTLLISVNKFFNGKPFTEINRKEEILTFLDHQHINGKWVKREHYMEGKYLSSRKYYLDLLRIFFRWLFNRNRMRCIGKLQHF